MKVDNRFRTAKLKIYYMLMLALIFSLSIYYYFERQAGYGYMIAVGIIVFIYLFLLFRKSNYFYLEDQGNKIIIRYYTAHPFLRKYRAFEIPKPYFFDYEIKKHLAGYRKTLQLTIKTPKGKFKYPPQSIVLLTDNQESDLIKILDKLKNK
ncbi:MAG: hypothetical protein GXO80_09470 [Chlorobi bacterium]|nr:hypothetical protein [Chlorobiota bacterium]